MPPLPGSPAIDGCTNGSTFTTDQRGFPRVVGPFADIGAVESGNPIPGFTPVVTVNGDVVNPIGVGGVSLRETIAFATYNTTITFGPALSGATIVLTNGQLNVPNSITILGPGSDVLTVSGNHTSRVFNITGTEVTISGLTIANGKTSLIGAGLYAGGGPGSVVNLTGCVVTNNFTTASGGGIYNDLNVAMTLSNCVITGNSVSGWGGGILNNGTPGQSAVLNLISSTVSNNSAYGGGGIDNLGSLTTSDCAISSNSAATWGGGIYNYQATLTVNTSTFSGNSADGEGGAIDNCGAWSGSARLNVSGSTFRGNTAGTDGGGIRNDGENNGNATATIGFCTLSNNVAGGAGGGIANDGGSAGAATLTVSNCTISSNSASVSGGGIFSDGESGGYASLTVSNSTLNANAAAIWGGGIYNLGQERGNASLAVWCSTLSGNTASGRGGGIDNDGYSQGQATTTLNTSTLSGNSAGQGGGIYNDGYASSNAAVTINASTLTANAASQGGGIYNDGEDGGAGSVEIGDTILNGGSGGTLANDSGAIISDGYNLSSDSAGGFLTRATDIRNTAPLLGLLQDNGGPTWTCALLPDSPAMDQGKANAVPGLGLTTDQRGFPRPVDDPYIANAPGGDGSDIGAYEAQCLIGVTNTADSGPGSLRAAVANSASGCTIVFAPNLSGQTILLTSGQIFLNQNLIVDASALSNGISINGNNAGRVFEVSNATVVLNSLTITNGEDNNDDNYGGGGIFIYSGNLTLNNCTVAGNSANYSWDGGGGIDNYDTVTLNQCTLSGNSANYSDLGGGGIDNFGTVTLNQCTLSGNSANYSDVGGGGIVNYDTVTLNQCTLSGNSANYSDVGGGGIVNFGTVTLNQCTLSGNSANNSAGGGGILNFDTLTLYNSIVAGNVPDNLSVYDDFDDLTGVNLTSGDPLLAPLGNYGGPTQTMPPLPGSPAIDACPNGSTFATDQRGYPRCSGARVDIGAVEAQWAPANQPPLLNSFGWTAPGGVPCFQCAFSSATNADFTVLATTNLALPLADWTVLAPAIQCSPGQYQFTDPAATNYPHRFYQVISP